MDFHLESRLSRGITRNYSRLRAGNVVTFIFYSAPALLQDTQRFSIRLRKGGTPHNDWEEPESCSWLIL